jgi:light-regulated signal transduction histidine kinase (bacteriophytochrome)
LFVEQLAAGLGDGGTERNEQLVDLLRRTVARARTLVDGILEYSRVGAAVQHDEVDMSVVVADVLSSLSARVAETDATFESVSFRRSAATVPSSAV